MDELCGTVDRRDRVDELAVVALVGRLWEALTLLREALEAKEMASSRSRSSPRL